MPRPPGRAEAIRRLVSTTRLSYMNAELAQSADSGLECSDFGASIRGDSGVGAGRWLDPRRRVRRPGRQQPFRDLLLLGVLALGVAGCNALLGNEPGKKIQSSGGSSNDGGQMHQAGQASGGSPGGVPDPEGGSANSGGGGAEDGGQSGAGSSSGGSGALDPAECEACGTLRLTESFETELFGSTTGGGLAADICPENQVAIGVEAWVNPNYVAGLAVVCGKLRLPKRAGAAQVSQTNTLALRGPAAGSWLLGLCPEGQVLTGIHSSAAPAAETVLLVSLELACASVTWSGQEGSIELHTEAATPVALPFPPRAAATLDDTRRCPADSVVRGLLNRSGAWVDGVGVVCSRPLAARPDGAPCSEDVECAGGRCDGTCSSYECEEPSLCQCRWFDEARYRFCKPLDFTAAAASCSAQGEQLVELTNRAENGWLNSTAKRLSLPVSLWLGADDKAKENVFMWKNRAEVADLGFWPMSGPTGEASKDCLLLGEDGRWRGELCDTQHSFVCQ
ncbi:MAG TPA: C-type lectin domain-containing protein [Polyangiaceae bacterium]|nr:C-type lectin domain-containing protein [Polyangiaceae bacterium]